MRARAAALASDPDVEEAAKRELSRSNSAVAAVAAGYFVAAGAHPDVLLGPLALLVAGIGTGGRVFDGRLRQPGLGAKRPRGFSPGDDVPDAARVALPGGVSALTVALAHDPVRTVTQVAKLGGARAREAGARERARVLERIAAVGPAALAETGFMRPLLHLASPSQAGLLSPADFSASGEVVMTATEAKKSTGSTLTLPFGEGRLLPGCEAIVAVDSRGVFAALAHQRVGDGLEVEALELVAALDAVPVERGRPRVRPGERLPFRASLSIACGSAGKPNSASARALPRGRKRALTLTVAQSDLRWVTATRR
jgi:gamma-glutamyltranspeptidase/glutathione hydrolase